MLGRMRLYKALPENDAEVVNSPDSFIEKKTTDKLLQ
jgi:hypothetical protein